MTSKKDSCAKDVINSMIIEDKDHSVYSEKDNCVITRRFADSASYSVKDRTAVSVRDGVIEYLGLEINLTPSDKIFTVYRSPATIANAAYKMAGIPLTDEHVSLDGPAPDTGSTVSTSEVIDQIDEMTNSRLAIFNRLAVSDSMGILLADKKQLSLGYFGDLIPHSKWDFEQVNIVPHHLAAVPSGRCGPLCSFLDRKPTKPSEGDIMPKMHEAFKDADGAVSLEQIVEIATALPEAIKKVPFDQLIELMPALDQIMSFAKSQGAMPGEGKQMKDEIDNEEKPKFNDAKFMDEMRKFADDEVKKFSEVIAKAVSFLDINYDFDGKTASQVMRDSLATESSDQFEDTELPIAFKLLRKSNTDYKVFGDSKPDGGLTARITKDLEA